jgi:aryl-alcohol dehydrogenase-like predicted oxidoreductase
MLIARRFDGPSGRPPEAALSIARRRGVSVHRILLAWLRAQSPNIVPLASASRPASIADSAASLDLADEDLADLRVGCSRTSFDLVKVQDKPVRARPIPAPSASGWYGWCE